MKTTMVVLFALMLLCGLVANGAALEINKNEPLSVQLVRNAKLPEASGRTIGQALGFSSMFNRTQWSVAEEDVINGVATVSFAGLVAHRGIYDAAMLMPEHEHWEFDPRYGPNLKVVLPSTFEAWDANVGPFWKNIVLVATFTVTMTERKYGDKTIPKGTVLYPKQIVCMEIGGDGTTLFPSGWHPREQAVVLFESALYPRYTSILNPKSKPSLDSLLTTYKVGKATTNDTIEFPD